MIYPHHRRRLEVALESGRLGPALVDSFGSSKPASATVDGGRFPEPTAPADSTWDAVDGVEQSAHQATYRFGGDASSGVSALLNLTSPARNRGIWTPTFEIGLSVRRAVPAGDAVRVVAAALVDVLTGLPAALPDLLGAPQQTPVEIHVAASSTDGHSSNRPNSITERLDLDPFGQPTVRLGNLMAASTRIVQPATPDDITELVVNALEFMLLVHGWPDPTEAIAALREEVSG
jgi:hypothetical protein